MSPSTHLIQQVVSYAGEGAGPQLARALALAEQAHAGQACRAGEPYVAHVIAVAEILSTWRAPVDVVIAGLLHDVADPRYTERPALDAARAAFGDAIAARIQAIGQLSRVGLSQLADEPTSLRHEAMMDAAQLPGIVRVLHQDPIAAVVKIADRIERLISGCALPEDQAQRFALATRAIFVSIANRLGMWHAKRELEDGIFRLVDPDAYAEAAELYSEARRVAAAAPLIQTTQDQLAAAGIQGQIGLMPASFYSLHRKTQQADKPIPLHLLTSLLIRVEDADTCYSALRALHQLWPPFSGQIWDYIASPKSNNYRGIHTRLRHPTGTTPLTVVIRTQEMDLIAERGITAAWAGAPEHLLPKPPVWREPPANRIAVFTPNGDLKILPQDATPIDFAYAIHPMIGHQCERALVNGEAVPLARALCTGDMVEIITSETSPGPCEDWLDKAKSRKARSEIRRWLMSQRPDGVAQKGWDLLDARLRETGATLTSAETAGRLQAVASEFGYNTARDLQIAIALGRVKPAKVLKQMQDAARIYGLPAPRAINVPPVYAYRRQRLAKCCRPIAPDAIVGYLTRQNEMVIHRADCPTVRSLRPLLSVEWQTRPWQDCAQLDITADDRAGLVRDIGAAVADLGIGMSHFHADRMDDGSARVTIDLDQTTRQRTETLVTHLRKLESVRELRWNNAPSGRPSDSAHRPPSPYTLSPVTGQRFFGRATELRRLHDYLYDPAPGKAILLWGPRRIGKTSLLGQLTQQLEDDVFMPVNIDLQSISGQDTTVFLYKVAQVLAAAANNQRVAVPKFNRMRSNPLGYFRSFMEALGRHESRHIILMLDEFQVLAGLTEAGATLADSFAYLRSLIMSGSQISFLFCGGGVLDTLRQQVGVSSLLNVTHTQKVDCLPLDEARRLIIEPAQHLHYDDDVVEDLLALTAGHPFYLQMLCKELADSAYQSNGTRVSKGHLQSVTCDWLPTEEEHHFNHLWGADSTLDPKLQQQYKLFLAALATLADDADRWVSFEAVRGALAPAWADERSLWRGLQALTKMDTLTFDGSERYRLKVPVCQRWIAANYTISRTMREII